TRVADLVPPDASRVVAALARVDAVAGDQRPVRAEVSVGDAVHQPVAKGGERDPWRGLRHAGGSAAELPEGSDGNREGAGERRVVWKGKVSVEAPFVEARPGAAPRPRGNGRAGG